MASSKDYLTSVLEQLSGLEKITYRAMMGEYILYFRLFLAMYDELPASKKTTSQK